jgi:hypothetical protein
MNVNETGRDDEIGHIHDTSRGNHGFADTIRPLATATSARLDAAPEPSTTVPSFNNRSTPKFCSPFGLVCPNSIRLERHPDGGDAAAAILVDRAREAH